MGVNVSEQARKYEKARQNRRNWKRIVLGLACIVVFCTTYALILPAITLEKTPGCGKEEHTHNESCYTQVIPESSENSTSSAAHVHTDNCFSRERGALICMEEETEGHTHSREAGCYTEDSVLVCNLPEDGNHTHSGACYEITEELVCSLEESAGHQHTDACYEWEEVPVCGFPAEQEAMENYGTWELTCQLEEHTHSLACYADLTADVETAADWEQTFAKVELTGVWARDALAIAESQLGYMESSDNYIVQGEQDTPQGYTRYGAWYGDPYGDWCAMFVSFCLNYAEVPEEAFPREASCSRWVELLKNEGLYAQAGEDYQPGEGDLVFFDQDGDGFADHMGLVQELRYSGETATNLSSFTTIEGNCGDKVARREYAANDGAILGYGVLSVPDSASPYAVENAWGYNQDGSIWWSTGANLEQITRIQENTPYIIAGYEGNNLMADETYTKENFSYLKAIPKEDVSDYGAYQRWYFEKEGESGTYYIYFLKTGEDGGEVRLYLQFGGAGVVEWGHPTQQLVLTEKKAEATVFTVARCTQTDYANYITVGAVADGETYYINSYYGDKPKSNGNTTHWLGYQEYSEGSFLKILQYKEQGRDTANRVETVNSANTVINLFDYWTAPNRTDPDNVNGQMDTGINAGHDFKFVHGDQPGAINLNKWRGADQLPRQGIIAKTLEDGRYPVLSGNQDVNQTASTESLAYLFDPSRDSESEENAVPGKKAYRNVSGLLTIDEQGYYAFDCKKNMAEFNEDSNSIYLYDKPGVSGQFFPFNKAPQVMTAHRDDKLMNHYFGMTITTRFVQRYGGHTDEKRDTTTSFHFSGDDDVWIFIDNVLVGDLGGIHDASSINIDFATGDIRIAVAKGTGAEKEITTTLHQCYQEAGKESATAWEGNIFADNTTHTLKFFYLERGNYDSNMELRYNLTEIPKTAIYKVNQYGEAVKGATFAVYAANEAYQMLSRKDGQVVPDENVSDPQYDANGNIVDGGGNLLVNALYTGTTDKKGEMIFLDQDGMPYTLNELKDMFGVHFILREIKVPEGYRVVSKDVNLEIWQGESQTILRCRNTTESGSRAASTLQITATDTLYLSESYQGDGADKGKDMIQYCDENGVSRGTLFAVVYKYTGKIDTQGNAVGVNEDKNWMPVYGSDVEGYNLIDTSGGKPLLEAALEAAVKAQEYGNVVFKISSNSTMQVTLENLPGHITTYYRMLGEDQKQQARYTVAYYWTDQNSIEEASPENTYRVNTFAGEVSGGSKYSGFERVFGANIQVPNLINKVFVQKMDETGNRINGATFALYQVQQQENGEIYYLAEDGSYVPLTDQAVIDENGVITNGSSTINPVNTDVTKTYPDEIHVGTAEFSNLLEGQYIIKEVRPPSGYKLNTADVMVLVTEDTIYANAGTEDDGITVGRGPGYVVSTLSQFASEGQIDNTLSWIYAQMQISYESSSFADVGDTEKIQGYLKENNSGLTGLETEAARTYLEYAPVHEKAAFNYVPNEKQTVENGAQNPTGSRRLFTTVGWPYYEIYQDYRYGVTQTQKNGANYEDWSSEQLTNLFSRSTYIRVTDVQETALGVKKVDATNQEIGLSGAQFRLYRMAGDGAAREYYIRSETGEVSWENDSSKALVVTTGAGGLSEEKFTRLSDGTYYLEEVKAPQGYHPSAEQIGLTITCAKAKLESPNPANGHSVDEGVLDENNWYTYTVTVPNSTGYVLPHTGGPGVRGYTLSGLILTGLSISLLYSVKRKERKQ